MGILSSFAGGATPIRDMSFLLLCRDVARAETNWTKRANLLLATDQLEEAITQFNKTRSMAAMQDLVALWTRAHIALTLCNPPPGGDPVGGRLPVGAAAAG